mgnify:FL=1
MKISMAENNREQQKQPGPNYTNKNLSLLFVVYKFAQI